MDIDQLVKLWAAERLELSDTVHGSPMQINQPNGVRSSDFLAMYFVPSHDVHRSEKPNVLGLRNCKYRNPFFSRVGSDPLVIP